MDEYWEALFWSCKKHILNSNNIDNNIWEIYRASSLKNSQEKNEGRILHGKKVSGRAILISNLQDFLLHFKTKKCFSIFLPINHPDVTISMGKKSTSL